MLHISDCQGFAGRSRSLHHYRGPQENGARVGCGPARLTVLLLIILRPISWYFINGENTCIQ